MFADDSLQEEPFATWRRFGIELANVQTALAEWTVWQQNEERPPELRRNVRRPYVSKEDLEELLLLLLTHLRELEDRYPEWR